MNARTRKQLLELNRVFYEAHAEAFDRSRGTRPWPGWLRLAALLTDSPPRSPTPPTPDPVVPRAAGSDSDSDLHACVSSRALGAVLDIGCGNGRFACFLHEAGFVFRYTGVDANATLLDSARRQLPEACAATARLLRHDFLAGHIAGRLDGHLAGQRAGSHAGAPPGAELPDGPFELVVVMGVLHHVPGAEARLALLQSAAARLAPGGRLALAIWRFEGDPREERKRVPFAAVGRVLGHSIDEAELEPGDALLRFGSDPASPPRYCHAVSAAEFESWPRALGLECVADYEADGPLGTSNRYAVLRRP
ncbi:MAG: class I SAM-dependent methyltransferase [Deltaproteobacteria bacterium]|nr:class I SAM-dependent methyltransferase [Deltaproteobacteria bacterium]